MVIGFIILLLRKQRVVINGEYSPWVLQGSILGPLLFLVYINDMPDYVQYNSTMALFADDSKFYKTIQDSKDSEYLQSDLTRLSLWCNDWDMKFNTSKGRHTPDAIRQSGTIF